MTSSPPLRPVLLGEMPSERGDEFYAFPLSGSPAVKLLRWAGIKKGEGAAYWTLIEHFHPVNAQERHAASFDLAKARARWTGYLLTECVGGATVVCLGRWAQRTVGSTPAPEGDWFEWREAGLLRYVTVPHPSGRNRLWNEPGAEEKMGLVLREALFLAGYPGAAPVIEDGRVRAVETTAPQPIVKFY